MTWGGHECTVNPDTETSYSYIDCPSKKVRIVTRWLQEYLKDKKRRKVGWSYETGQNCDMWEDDVYVHIGCIKEEKDEFYKKYVQVIKQLNNSKNG